MKPAIRDALAALPSPAEATRRVRRARAASFVARPRDAPAVVAPAAPVAGSNKPWAVRVAQLVARVPAGDADA